MATKSQTHNAAVLNTLRGVAMIVRNLADLVKLAGNNGGHARLIGLANLIIEESFHYE